MCDFGFDLLLLYVVCVVVICIDGDLFGVVVGFVDVGVVWVVEVDL